MAREPKLLRPRAFLLLLIVAPLLDCECLAHPLYNEDANRFDTWYLGGGNTANRPFRRGEVPADAVLEVELALDRDGDGTALVRALVIDAIDVTELRGELWAGGERVAEFIAIDDEQLLARLPPDRVRAASLLAVFDDGHGGRLEIAIPSPELRDALDRLPFSEESRP